jgi:hypothetical protein
MGEYLLRDQYVVSLMSNLSRRCEEMSNMRLRPGARGASEAITNRISTSLFYDQPQLWGRLLVKFW